MNKLQQVKYSIYIIISGLGLLSTIHSMFVAPISLFTIGLLIIFTVFLSYSIFSLKTKRNLLQAILPKGLLYCSRVLITLFILSFITCETLVFIKGTEQTHTKTDYIIVLGAGINGDKPSKALRYRLDEAIRIYEENPNATIICSGGKSGTNKYSEAEVMMIYLQEHGINKSHLLKEDKSTTTKENLIFSRKLMRNAEAPVILVTNNFHALRSQYLADKLGINATVSASQKNIPAVTQSYIREYFSFIKAIVF